MLTRTFVYLGRFEDSEFASQARMLLFYLVIFDWLSILIYIFVKPVFAGINILSIYHDSILTRAAAEHAAKTGTLLPPSTSFNRYTRYWLSHSNAYKRISRLLTLTSYTEVLLEMGVKKMGTKCPVEDRDGYRIH